MSAALTAFCLSSRWEQIKVSAIQAQLGLDFPGKGILPSGRGCQIPGGDTETQRLPGGNFLCQ